MGLEINRSVSLQVVLYFSVIAVFGYVLKDRIKASAGPFLKSKIPHLLYDRRLDLVHEDADDVLGNILETFNFESPESLPEEIQEYRAETAQSHLHIRTQSNNNVVSDDRG